MDKSCLLKELTALAKSNPEIPRATYLKVSAQSAARVVNACALLSETNRDDLLSHGESEMVFLSNAILENPKTSYQVVKANHAIVLEARTAKAKRTKSTPRLSRGMSKTSITEKVYTAAKRAGFKTTKNRISVMRVSNGQQVSIKAEAGFPYSQVLALRTRLAAQYSIRGQPLLAAAGGGEQGAVKVIFVISDCKKKA